MEWTSGRLRGGFFLLSLLSGVAAGAPGLCDEGADGESRLTILEIPQTRPCVLRGGGLCFFAADRTTIAVESAPVTDAAPTVRVATADRSSRPPVRPRFSRAAADEKSSRDLRDQPWQLALTAMLRRPAWAGNAMVVIYDLDEPQALATRTIMGLYQALIPAGRTFGAQLSLSPDDGYRGGRTYRVQVLQLIDGKEILLAESDVTLL